MMTSNKNNTCNNNTSRSPVAPRRPPLHPSIRVDAKTFYNAIDLEAFEEEENGGGHCGANEEEIIDLTTMMDISRKRTPAKTTEVEDASFSSDTAVQGAFLPKSPSSNSAVTVSNLIISNKELEHPVENRDDEQDQRVVRGDAQKQQQSNGTGTLSVNTTKTGEEALTEAGETPSHENQTVVTEGSVIRIFSNKLKAGTPSQIQTSLSEEDTSTEVQSNHSSSPPTSPSRFGAMFRKAALKLRSRRRSPRKGINNSVDPVIEPTTPDSNAATAHSSSSTYYHKLGAQDNMKEERNTESQNKGNTQMLPAYVQVKGKSSADVVNWKSQQTIEQHPDDEEPASSSERELQGLHKFPPVSTETSISKDDEEEFPSDLHSTATDSRSYPTFTGRFAPTESMSTWTGNNPRSDPRRSVWDQPSWPSPHQLSSVEFTVHRKEQEIQEVQSLGEEQEIQEDQSWEEAATMDSFSATYTKSIPPSTRTGLSTNSSEYAEQGLYSKSTPYSSSTGTSRESNAANTSGSYTTFSIQNQSSNSYNTPLAHDELSRYSTTSVAETRSSTTLTKPQPQGQTVDRMNSLSRFLPREAMYPFGQKADFLESEQQQHDGAVQPYNTEVNNKTLEAMRNQRANLFSSLTSMDESSAKPSSVAPSQKTAEEREERLAALRALRSKRQQQLGSSTTAGKDNWIQTGTSLLPLEAASASFATLPTSSSNCTAATSMPPTVPSQTHSETDDPRMAWIAVLRAKRQTMLSSYGTSQQHHQGPSLTNHYQDISSQRNDQDDEQQHTEYNQMKEPIRSPQVETVAESKSMTTQTTTNEYTTASSQVSESPTESNDGTIQANELPDKKDSDEIYHVESSDQAVIDVHDSIVPIQTRQEPKDRLPSILPSHQSRELFLRSEWEEHDHTEHNMTFHQQHVIDVENKYTLLDREPYASETPRSDIAVHGDRGEKVIQVSSDDQEENIIEIVSDDQDDIVHLEPDGAVLGDDFSRTGWYQYDDFRSEAGISGELAVITITQSIEDTVCGSVRSKKTVTFQDIAEHEAEAKQEDKHYGIGSDSNPSNNLRHSLDPTAVIHVPTTPESVTCRISKSHPVDPLPSQFRPRQDPPTLTVASTDISDEEEMQPIVVDRENEDGDNKRTGILQRARAVLAAQDESKKSPRNSRRNGLAQLSNAGATSTIEETSKDSIIDLIRVEEEFQEEGQVISDMEGISSQSATESVDRAKDAPLSPVVTESHTGDEPDSPFEKIRRRLVRLDIEDFRSVVMTRGNKGQGTKLDERLQHLVNKDEDSDEKTKDEQLIGEKYSHDLALSDCDSQSEDDRKECWSSSILKGSRAKEEKEGATDDVTIDVENDTDKATSEETAAGESFRMQLDGLRGPNPTDEITLQGDPADSNKHSNSTPSDTDTSKVSGNQTEVAKIENTPRLKEGEAISEKSLESKKKIEEKASDEAKAVNLKSINFATNGVTYEANGKIDKAMEESSILRRTDDILNGLDKREGKLANLKLPETKSLSESATQPMSNNPFGSQNKDTTVPRKATLNSSTRVRFEEDGVEPLKNSLGYTHRERHMSEIDDETDVSDTRDSLTKVSYLETDDESDLETAFESSTVPLLVRMLDRGCAWLEDSNACGLGPPPSLLKQTTRSRAPGHLESKQSSRNKKQHSISSHHSGQSQQSYLPSTLPKSSSKASKTPSKSVNPLPQLPLVSKFTANTAERTIPQKDGESEAQISSKSEVSTRDASQSDFPITPTPKSNRPKFNRKIRKGPRSTKKSKTLFDLPMFKSDVDGEYKLSSGFFNKDSDTSSLETMTDNSSYDNPIRLEGMEELNKAAKREGDDYDAGSPTHTPKTSNMTQEMTGDDRFSYFTGKSSDLPFLKATSFPEAKSTADQTISSGLQPQHHPVKPVKQSFVEDAIAEVPRRTLRFETDEVTASQKGTDVSSNQYFFKGNNPSSGPRPEKEELSFSPRKQGLPPSPNANRATSLEAESNVDSEDSEMMTFQDKLQMRLTRVREIAPTLLLEDSDFVNGGEFYAGLGGPEAREPDEEIAEPVSDTEDDNIDHQVSKTSTVQNHVQGENPTSDQENKGDGNSVSSLRSQSESERLAALALAEKLRQRAAKLKEKRRQRETGQQGARTRKRPEDRPRERIIGS